MRYNTSETIEDIIDRLYEEKIIKQKKEESYYKDHKPSESKTIDTGFNHDLIRDIDKDTEIHSPRSLLEKTYEPGVERKRLKAIRKKKPGFIKKTTIELKKRNLGKKVYLEENGEVIGVVNSIIYDEYTKDIIGYEVKDKDSDATLRLPTDQFIEDKKGLILIPSWYINAVKTIERIEFKERITPELAYLSPSMNTEEKKIFLNNINPELIRDLDESIKLRETLRYNIKVYKEQRNKLNNEILEIIKKRVVDDIDRYEFSNEVNDKRKKIRILDLLINRCMTLVERLDNTVIGRLGLEYIPPNEIETRNKDKNMVEDRISIDTMGITDEPKTYSKPLSLHHKQESLTAMIAELLEDKILEDIKRHLIKNQLSSYDRVNAYGEMQKQEDDKDAYIKMLEEELKQKKNTIKYLQEELTKIIK